MTVCSGCGTDCQNEGARFCPTCGKSLVAAVPVDAQKKHALYGKYAEPYYRGTIKSVETPEVWSYDKGQLKCNEGNPRGTVFKWTGSELVNEGNQDGVATWDGHRLEWHFPLYSKEAFYTYNWDEGSQTWKNESGMLRSDPVQYTSFVHWVVEKDRISTVKGSDVKEGTSSSFEFLGDVPPPVALLVAMHSRAQKLLEEAILRSKRSYKRCGKITLQGAAVTPVFLCKACDDGCCLSCDKPLGAQKFSGKLCKTCAPRKNFCTRCADPLNGSTKEGFLCTSCGLGSASQNCCKMNFTIRS